MNILIMVDENIPQMTVAALGSMGHDVLDIRGAEREGISDDVIWELAQSEGRLLITTDKAFAQYRNEFHYGVLIVRLRQPNRYKIHNRVIQAIAQFEPAEWPGLLVVMRDEVQGIWRTT